MDLRLLFLKDVMTRYYDPRKVIIDIIANFYKEQKPELIPNMVACANDFILHQGSDLALQPIMEKEVKNYYREDEIIWSMYLTMRQFDRFIRKKVLQRDYPISCPEKLSVEMEALMAKKALNPKVEMIDLFARHVSSGKVDYFTQVGINFVAGEREGIYLYDLDGKRLINCHSNGGVFNLGHPPRTIAALQRALIHDDIGNHHLISAPRARLAERLDTISPGDIQHAPSLASPEAKRSTWQLSWSRGHTRRPQIISALGGYHGHTGLALAAGDEAYRKPFEPLSPGFVQVPFGDLDALEAAMGDNTATVLFETIPATLGIAIPHEDFYAGVRRLCDQWGAVMIMDEVQTGLGRCGQVWGIDTYGVAPDIIVTGKGLSGGIYPMSATLCSDRLDSFMRSNPFIHVSTFGGAEVGCFVALEVLDMLEEVGFLENVRAIARVFEDGFARLCQRHPAVLEDTTQRA